MKNVLELPCTPCQSIVNLVGFKRLKIKNFSTGKFHLSGAIGLSKIGILSQKNLLNIFKKNAFGTGKINL